MEKGNYKKFFLMLTVSFLTMYAVMFLNVDQLEHVYLSTTRLYMTLLMVAPMAVVMLLMMQDMYKNKTWNIIILLACGVIFGAAFLFLRNAAFVGDRQYIKAMIPHHSSAIVNSQEANLQDPELKRLAENIIKTQQEEIAEMKRILTRIEQ